MQLQKKSFVILVATLPLMAHADFEYQHGLLIGAQDVASQIYNQQKIELSQPICTANECTSNIIANDEIVGFVSSSTETNSLNDAIRFNFKEYNYETQKYTDSFVVILNDNETKYFTDKHLADYAFQNGLMPSTRSKRGVKVEVSCKVSVSYDRPAKEKADKPSKEKADKSKR